MVAGSIVAPLAAVRMDLGDELSFSKGGGHTASYASLKQSQIERVLEARLPAEDKLHAAELSRHLLKVCRSLGFEPAFALALIEVESTFRPRAVSPVGAIGLLQLMPRTAAPLAKQLKVPYGRFKDIRTALRDPYFNITLGLSYMNYLRGRYAGMSPYWWVAAYNMGPTRLNRLRSKPDFRPTHTVAYYRKIRSKLAYFRHYRGRDRAI